MTTAFVIILLAGCGEEGSSPGDTDSATSSDADGDGYDFEHGDCDDADPAVNPAVAEDPGTAGDENCDGSVVLNAQPLLGVRQAEIFGTNELGVGSSLDLGVGAAGGLLIGAPGAWFSSTNEAAAWFQGVPEGASKLAEGTVVWTYDPLVDGIGQDLGTGVAFGGDVTGDGVDDFLVGEEFYSGVKGGSGAIFVTSATERGAVSASDAFACVQHGVFGMSLGAAVAGPVDWDGDGVGDVVASSAYGVTGDDGVHLGYVGLYLGPLMCDGSDLPDEGVAGADAEQLGVTPFRVGFDANGDGHPDLVAGGLNYGDSHPGRAVLFYGPDLPEYADDGDVIVAGSLFDQEVGYSVSAGDVNGDSIDDLAVGAALDSTPGTRGGRAGVFLAPFSGNLDFEDADTMVSAEGESRFLGAGITIEGDFDGDGRHDLAVGAPWDPYSGADYAGSTFLWLTLPPGKVTTADADLALVGDYLWGEAGRVLASGADLDGDGTDELAIGAPRDSDHGMGAGRAWLVLGSTIRDLVP